MMADWENATSNVGRLAAEAEQRVSLAATPLIASSVLPQWLQAFRKTHPAIRVSIRDLDRRNILLGIEAGELDVGLGAFFRPATGIDRQLLARFDMVLVRGKAKGSRTRRGGFEAGREVNWSVLNDQEIVVLPNDNPIQKLVDAQLRALEITTRRTAALREHPGHDLDGGGGPRSGGPTRIRGPCVRTLRRDGAHARGAGGAGRILRGEHERDASRRRSSPV
jgi:DNA-binding transcriptional LysR family regulator